MTDSAKEMLFRVGLACDRACEKLPEDWQIGITLEQGCGNVDLYNPDGDHVEFPSNQEFFHETINDAIDYAIEQAGKEPHV